MQKKVDAELSKRLGGAFSRKASDLLCRRIQTSENVSDPPGIVIELDAELSGGRRIAPEAIVSADARRATAATLKHRFEQKARTIQGELNRLTENRLESCWLNQCLYARIPERLLSEIASDPLIKAFDIPRPIQIEGLEEPGFFVFVPQWADRQQSSGKGVSIALIDSEVSVSHPALAGRVIQKRNHTEEGWGTPHWHGTGVAGIIAGRSEEIRGIAPDSVLHNYKVIAGDDSSRSSDFHGSLSIQEALEDGMDIVNCSWGDGEVGDGTSRNARACNEAWDLGLVIIKSSGNNGTLTSPADAEGIIVVGATDIYASDVPDYSGRGRTSDGRSRPHLVAPGGSPQAGMFSCGIEDQYGVIGFGTSFAAPVVSGIAARILEREPQLSPGEVRSKILDLCKPVTGNVEIEGKGVVSLVKIVL